MPRTLWRGAVSFGLVTIPVRVYGATETKDISFRQIHPADGGRIRYKRVCEVCGKEIPYAEIAKGYEAADGRMAILTEADFAGLPAAEGKTVDVVQFVELDQIDPLYYEKSYVLEADGTGAKPYALLRQALAESGRAAVVRVALRGRESLALIRPREEVLVLHTMLWPDELRDLSFAAPPEATVTEPEVAMARLFIDQLSADFDPSAFTDTYREELEKVVQARLEGVPLPESEEEEARPAEVVDLVAALRASVEAAKRRREAEAS